MRDTPTAALMFAAGFGTRMKALTAKQPKPMIPVAGKPLVDHALTLLRDAGVETIVANLHYKPDVLRAHLEEQGVDTITELPDILETGGGLRNSLSLLGEAPVFTLNTDAVWQGPNPVEMLAQAWNPTQMDALLIGIPPAQAQGHKGAGDFTITSDGRLTRGPGLVYGGVQIIKTDLLQSIEKETFSLNILWDKMLENGRLFGLPYPGEWCDVGHPEGIKVAERMLAYV
jgi:MurNAc alpha-1-phosphate uridylyltransferase